MNRNVEKLPSFALARTDADIAAELKTELVAALQPVLRLCERAAQHGMQAQWGLQTDLQLKQSHIVNLQLIKIF